jgi:hypothetical protein
MFDGLTFGTRVRVQFDSYTLEGRVFETTLVALVLRDNDGIEEICWSSQVRGVERL